MSAPPEFYHAMHALLRSARPAPERYRQALLLSGVMRQFAIFCDRAAEADYWAAAGLLYGPEEGASPLVPLERIKAAGADPAFLAAISRQAPVSEEDSFATLLVTLAHLTTLISAIAATRPRHSVEGLKVSAVQKKFLDHRFSPSSNRNQIKSGVRALHWEIGNFTSKTLKAIRACEDDIRQILEESA